ncbi:MAG: Trk system potassium transporter TrkA [Chromatiaceae bacterium]|jgi:trk system potassium uptake protein TrkA|nr:Trk system potassium transporter TrkA [Chromatiaceae bacterium]
MNIFIAGAGQVAAFIGKRLVNEGHEVTLVERSEERCRELESQLDARIIHGNAASIATWRRAGIERAEMLITVTQSDELNLLAALIVHAQAPQAVKAVRLRTPDFQAWRGLLQDRGIKVDRIIHPETDIIARILRVLPVPGVSDIRDFAEGAVKMFGMNVERGSWLVDKTLRDLEDAGPPPGSMVAMIFRGSAVIIPHGNEALRAGDHLYTVTTRDSLQAFMDFMGIKAQVRLQRVFIVGGDEVGVEVARALEGQGVAVKLFEEDPAKCEAIAEALEKTVVIHGDGTDQETLWQANIEGIDAFLALTDNDNSNVIAGLIARRLGAAKVVTQVNRLNYMGMVGGLGINTTVSPRLKAVDAILEFVRKGDVLSVRSFGEEAAEAIEIQAPATSPYIGRPLRAIRLPRDAIVAAIARQGGDVIVPRGDDTIEAGDRVVFVALEHCVSELETAFLAKPRSRWLRP